MASRRLVRRFPARLVPDTRAQARAKIALDHVRREFAQNRSPMAWFRCITARWWDSYVFFERRWWLRVVLQKCSAHSRNVVCSPLWTISRTFSSRASSRSRSFFCASFQSVVPVDSSVERGLGPGTASTRTRNPFGGKRRRRASVVVPFHHPLVPTLGTIPPLVHRRAA